MWQWLMNVLPDIETGGRVSVQDLMNMVIGLVGVVVGALGSYLAWSAIKMGREQGRLATRQAEIAEAQHNIIAKQLAQVSQLRIRAARLNSGMRITSGLASSPIISPVIVWLEVQNIGTKNTDGFYWQILIPRELRPYVYFIDQTYSRLEGDKAFLSEDPADEYEQLDGHYDKKLFPRSPVCVARLSVVNHTKTEQFSIKWRTVGDDGPVPPEGFAELQFTRSDDDSYDVKYVMAFPELTAQL